jgi:hypothetical protein
MFVSFFFQASFSFTLFAIMIIITIKKYLQYRFCRIEKERKKRAKENSILLAID